MKNPLKSIFKTMFCKHQIKENQDQIPVFAEGNSYDYQKPFNSKETVTAHDYGVGFDKALVDGGQPTVEVKTKNKISKLEQVKSHLIKEGSIDSWTAITLYKATRLSGIIYVLRNIHGMDIESIISKDKSHFATYVYAKNESN
jgi:hypothetical protein